MNYESNNITLLQTVDQINEQAANWLAKLVSGPLTEEESAALQVWLGNNPRHRQTLLELADVWDELDTLSELAQMMPIEPTRELKKNTLNQRRGVATAIADYFKPLWGGAAAVLVICGFLFFSEFSIQSTPDSSVLFTQIGEKRSVTLSDKSVVTLNTGTHIEMDFTNSERNLTLVKGEAHFQVAKDEERPFIVNVDGVRVRAVGTAFNIQKSSTYTEVIVTEGVVQVDQPQFSLGGVVTTSSELSESANQALDSIGTITTQRIEAGHFIILMENAESFGKIEDNQLEKQLAWQSGRLVFNGETMVEVVEEISRYTDRRILFKDETVKQVRVGGYFHTEDIDEMLDILEEGFDIKVSKSDTGDIFLSSLTATEIH